MAMPPQTPPIPVAPGARGLPRSQLTWFKAKQATDLLCSLEELTSPLWAFSLSKFYQGINYLACYENDPEF